MLFFLWKFSEPVFYLFLLLFYTRSLFLKKIIASIQALRIAAGHRKGSEMLNNNDD